MYKKFLSLMVCFISLLATAQNVAINSTGNAPDASAMLDVQSTSKGLLIPRMSTPAITSISNPAKGLLVLDTLTNQLMVNMGIPALPDWQTIIFKSGWSLKGNSSTNPATNFLGTTDNQPLRIKLNNIWAGEISPSAGNVFLGKNSGVSNTTSFSNVSLGVGALYSNTNRSNLVAIGDSALYNNGTGASAIDDANYNTAVGSKSLYSNTTGFYNTAVGFNSLQKNTTGSWNTALGSYSLYRNTTGANNTAIGNGTLGFNTTGTENTALGVGALYYNSTGIQNTAVGSSVLGLNTTGGHNTGIGNASLLFNTTGNMNTAVGDQAIYSNTTGYYNTAVGWNALHANTTANSNTAIGNASLFYNTTGSENTAIGMNSLFWNNTGYQNTAVGSSSLYENTTGSLNTVIGRNACNSNTTGSGNTASGFAALNNNTTGNYNTALGYSASNVESGLNYNTMVGAYSQIQNASGCTAIGYNASTMNTNNLIVLGSPPIAYTGGYTNWTNFSDGRFKKNVNEEVRGLDFIMRLRPVTYHMDIRGLYNFWGSSPYGDGKVKMDEKAISFIDDAITKKEAIAMSGFIAQEVEKAAQECNYVFDGVSPPQNDKDHYRIAYAEFVVPLVKAVQEQQKMIEKQNNIISDLLKRITSLEKRIE